MVTSPFKPASRMASLVLSALLLLAPTSTSALHLPNIDKSLNLRYRAAAAAAGPLITPAPSPEALERNLRRDDDAATVAPCAARCLSSIVTKSTSCQTDDQACMCALENAYIIQFGAAACVQNACGYFVAESIWSSAAEVCTSIRDGDYTPTRAGKTTAGESDAKNSPSTQTKANTSPGSEQTGGSSPGSSSNSASESPSSSSDSGSSSHSLSKGAIAGIAVGAAGGAILICAILFLIYRCMRSGNRTGQDDSQPPQPGAPPPATGAAAVPIGGGKPELDGKEGAYMSGATPPTATPSPAPPVSPIAGGNGVSRNPSTVSAQSPGTQGPGYPSNAAELGAWQQQQQHQQQSGQLLPGGGQQPPFQQQGGYGPPAQPGTGGFPEVQGARPEVMGDTHIRQELHGQPYGAGMYELPGSQVRR